MTNFEKIKNMSVEELADYYENKQSRGEISRL